MTDPGPEAGGTGFQKAGIDLGLVVGDVELMSGFYEEVLGLTRGARRVTGWGTMVEMHADASVVRLLQPPGPPPRGETGLTAATGFRYLTLCVADAAACLDRAAAAGATVTVPLTRVRDVAFGMVSDPEGNIVEFLARGTS